MNERSDIERTLQTWMRDDVVTMPERVVDSVAHRISVQPQRRAWPFPGRTSMTTPMKLIAALAATLVVAVVGWQLLPGDGGFGGTLTPAPSVGPTPTPRDALSPTAPTACEDELPGCAGPLAAGRHQSSHFTPTFDYTTPDGWSNSLDTENVFGLVDRPGAPDPILVWSDVVPAENTAACQLQAKPGAGTSVADWLAYLNEHPGLVVTNQHDISMNGTSVPVLDVTAATTWESPCVADRPGHNVPLLKMQPNAPTDGYGVLSTSRARLYVVGIGNQTVIVSVYSYEALLRAFEDVVARAEPVVSSFAWACNDQAPPGPCWGPPDASGNPATPPPGS